MFAPCANVPFLVWPCHLTNYIVHIFRGELLSIMIEKIAGDDDAVVDVPRVDVHAAGLQVLRRVLARGRGVAGDGALC